MIRVSVILFGLVALISAGRLAWQVSLGRHFSVVVLALFCVLPLVLSALIYRKKRWAWWFGLFYAGAVGFFFTASVFLVPVTAPRLGNPNLEVHGAIDLTCSILLWSVFFVLLAPGTRAEVRNWYNSPDES